MQPLNIYSVYPHKLIFNETIGAFKNISDALPHIKNSGFNAVHLLPFFKSPRKDGGYDISDYFAIDEMFGSEQDFSDLVEKASKLGLKIIIDFVFNHMSIESDLFKAALAGGNERDFFIWTDSEPNYIRTKDDHAYYNVNGKEIAVKIMFPDFVGAIPHWEKFKDGRWYYHTFRKDQLDLNWNNKQVGLFCAKVISFWAMRGVSFRIDAAAYLGGNPYKSDDNVEHVNRNLKILKTINSAIKFVNKKSLVVLEAQGSEKYYNKDICDCVYDFKLNSYFWYALLHGHTDLLNKHVQEIISKGGINFTLGVLRSHDELENGYVCKEIAQEIESVLLARGNLNFQHSRGVVGRLASFLNKNSDAMKLSFFMLMLYPMPNWLVFYGDEFGIVNKTKFDENMTGVLYDKRNLHRNSLYVNRLTRKEKSFHESFTLISRFSNEVKQNFYFQSFDVTRPHVSGLMYKSLSGNDYLHVLINFDSKTSFRIKLNTDVQIVFNVNFFHYENNARILVLGPTSAIAYKL